MNGKSYVVIRLCFVINLMFSIRTTLFLRFLILQKKGYTFGQQLAQNAHK